MSNPNGMQSTSKDVDPSMVALAERVAKDLIDCDPSILSLMVIDDLGRVLHVAKSARLSGSAAIPPEQVRVFGTIAKTVSGAANQASQLFGATEAVIGVFKSQKVLLVNVREYNLLLAIRLARSASAEYVCDKIGDLLALKGEP